MLERRKLKAPTAPTVVRDNSTEYAKTPSNTGVTTSSFNIVKHLQHEAA